MMMSSIYNNERWTYEIDLGKKNLYKINSGSSGL